MKAIAGLTPTCGSDPAGNGERGFSRARLNIAVFSVNLLLSLVVIEVILRIHNPFQVRIRGEHIVLPTNVSQTFRLQGSDRFGGDVIVRRNSIGFRGPDPPQPFENHLTLITIGGSTTECLYLDDPDTWPGQLERRLQTEFRDAWVNNAGLDGHSTFGHLMLLRDIVIPLKPRVVVFLIGANDVGRDDLSDCCDASVVLSRRWQLRLSERSELLTLGYNLYLHLKAIRAHLIYHPEWNLRTRETLAVSDDTAKATLALHHERYLPSYRQRVTRLLQLTRDAGIQPVVVTQPTLAGDLRDDVTGANLGDIKIYDAFNGRLYWQVLQAYNATTTEVAKEAGVPVIPAADEMPKSSRYFYDFGHFTKEGAAELARVISKHLGPILAERFPTHVK